MTQDFYVKTQREKNHREERKSIIISNLQELRGLIWCVFVCERTVEIGEVIDSGLPFSPLLRLLGLSFCLFSVLSLFFFSSFFLCLLGEDGLIHTVAGR